MADATRCGRPDCISLREELELLRGDLRELAAESDALHDALATKDADAQRVIAAKDGDLARLSALVQQLTTQLAAGAPAAATAAPAATTTERSKPALQTDDAAAADRLALARECEQLRAANAALETQVRELRAGARTQEHAAAAAATAVTRDAKDKRGELLSVLQENELLRGEKGSLEAALRAMTEAASENEALVKALYAHQSAYKDAVDEQTIEITQLHAKLEQLEREKARLEAQLVEMDERECDVEALLRDAKRTHDAETTVLRNELSALQKRAAELEQQQQQQLQQQRKAQQQLQQQQQQVSSVSGGSASTRTAADDTEEAERQLELLQELRIRDKHTIAELTHRVQQQQSDLESLVEHLDVDAAVESAVQSAVAQEAAKCARVRQEHSSLTRRLKEQGELVREVELRQARLEKELAVAREWNARYERGAGLEDVMKFHKQLRRQLETQQQANAALRQELSAQLEATGKCRAAFERLKAESGKARDFEYDDLALERHLQGELAANQAVVTQMELQLQELERDRVRLLQKLREQARVGGLKLYEAHGVTPEQWRLVEEFIDRVRHTPEVAKRMLAPSGGESDRGGEFDDELDGSSVEPKPARDATAAKLEVEVEIVNADNMRLVAEVARLRDELEHAQTQVALATSRVGDDDDRHTRAPSAAADDIKQIREQVERIVREQELQRSERRPPAAGKAADDAPLDSLSSSDDGEQVVASRSSDTVEVQRAAAPAPPAAAAPTPPTAAAPAPPAAAPAPPAAATPAASTAATPAAPAAVPAPPSEGAEPLAPSRAPSLEPPSDWGSVESIAAAVATALEHKLALLRGAQLPPAAHDAPGTAAAPTADALAFESEEEMTRQLDALAELNMCLDELVRAEAQNAALQQQLAQHELAFRAVADQHTVLYQHLFHLHAEHAARGETQQREVAELADANRDLQRKCERYEAALHTLAQPVHGGTETRMRAELVELTRRTAVHEANEAAFRRKYEQLHAELCAAQTQTRALEGDWLEMEKTLKYRVLYLESWKQGADALLERMERALERSVPKLFAERQERAALQLLCQHEALSEAHGELRVTFAQTSDLPQQLSRARHENALLLAEKRASGGGGNGAAAGVDAVLRARISQLEFEAQLQRAKEVEAAATAGDALTPQLQLLLRESDVEKENALLVERVGELEQLYESLARECAKYKDVAALAASQANTLARRSAQAQARRDAQPERARELAAASADHAVVGRLQQQLTQLTANYQHFLVKYDGLAEREQRAAIAAQQLELELERRSQALRDVREQSRSQLAVLEATLAQAKERDLTARNAKWEAFRRRLDGLEDELRRERGRRQALEAELEEAHARLPRLAKSSGSGSGSESGLEVTRLKARVEALETRERALLEQLESAASHESEEALQAELAAAKQLNDDALRQLRAAQTRVSELVKANGELESGRRQLAREKEDAEIELQHARLERIGDDDDRDRGNQAEGSQSPLMRRKVGLYEQDQAALQQAAQATVASLKQLVEEKNALLAAYQQKAAAARLDAAHAKAQDRLEAAQLNKKLFEENQRVIAELKDAAATIRRLERSGKSRKAAQAALERHEHVLHEWKQAEVALEAARQTIRERDAVLAALTSERDIAEARAGEALEEIVLAKHAAAAQEVAGAQLARRLEVAKRELASKGDKMALLRDAVVRLKEEFLKAEERHAVAIAKAQATASAAASGSRRTATTSRREEEEQWREEKDRLESQLAMLQEKLELMRKRERAAAAKAKSKSENAKAPLAAESKRRGSDAQQEAAALASEVQRLRRVVQERAVADEALAKKLRVLEAQNRALREVATTTAPTAPKAAVESARRGSGGAEVAEAASRSRERWEAEKKLQRRNEQLAARLAEAQRAADAAAKEESAATEQLRAVQQELVQLRKAAAEQTRAGAGATAPSASASALADDLERQNRFLQETLVLKRREWEDAAAAQVERYERELQRLRRRLSQRRVPPDDEAAEPDARAAQLRREEQQFLAGADVGDELALLGDELRAKEQEALRQDSRLLATELELETARVEQRRLQRKCAALETQQQQQQQQPSGSKTKLKFKPKPSEPERQELEAVIAAMKRVLEKLRAENEQLRKRSVSPGKLEQLRRQLAVHRSAREQLEAQNERLRAEAAALKADKLRLQHKLRAATTTTATTATRPPSDDSDALRAQLAVKEDELAAKDAETRELRATIAGLELQIRELESRAAGGDSGGAGDEAAMRELEDENARLRSELAAFDAEFFEEVEDLKFKYAQAERERRRLERRLAAQ